MEAPQVQWRGLESTAEASSLSSNVLQGVLAGLTTLRVTAELSGTLGGLDGFQVRSNLDQAVADQLARLAGDALRAGRARARAEVDRVSLAAVDSAAEGATDSAEDVAVAIGGWRAQLEGARRQLEDQIKSKTAGLGVF